MRKRVVRDVALAVAVVGIAAAVLLPVLGFPPFVKPFNGETILAFNIGSNTDGPFLGRFFGSWHTAYRPVTYTAFQIEYELWGLGISSYLMVNLSVWMACGLLCMALARTAGAGALVGALAGVALLVDPRAASALVWVIELQTLLACAFGAGALALAYGLPEGGRRRAIGLVALGVLLVAAAMSKEYGLAFAPAVLAVLAIRAGPGQRRAVFAATVGAVLLYASMRWLISGPKSSSVGGVGPGSSYCQEMGLLDRVGDVCPARLGPVDRLGQQAWNACAALVGTFYPSLFGEHGELRPPWPLAPLLGDTYQPSRLGSFVYPTLLLALAVAGWVRRPRETLPLAVLLVANAALGYVIYKERNLVIGALALHASAAAGLSPAVAFARGCLARLPRPTKRRLLTRTAIVLAVAVAAVGLAAQMSNTRSWIRAAAAEDARLDPCFPAKGREGDLSVNRRLAARYGEGRLDPAACD